MRGLGQAVAGRAQRNDCDAKDRAVVVTYRVKEGFDGGVPLDDIDQLGANVRRQIREFDAERFWSAQKAGDGAVGVDELLVRTEHERADCQAVEHVAENAVIADELGVEPAVLDRETKLLEQMVDEQQFLVGKFAARDPVAQHGHAEGAFAIVDRDGNLAAQHLELPDDFRVEKRRRAAGGGAENLRMQRQLAVRVPLLRDSAKLRSGQP